MQAAWSSLDLLSALSLPLLFTPSTFVPLPSFFPSSFPSGCWQPSLVETTSKMRSFALLLLALAAHCIIAAPHDRPLRGRANFHKSVGKQARSIGRLGLAGNANVTTHTIPPSLGTTFKTFKASTNTISLSGARRGDVRSMQPMMYFQQHAVSQVLCRTVKNLTRDRIELWPA